MAKWIFALCGTIATIAWFRSHSLESLILAASWWSVAVLLDAIERKGRKS